MTDESESAALTGKHLPFDEGLPTKPDVDLLMQTWPELKVGDQIAYSTIEKLIGNPQESRRFRTITNAWRRRWSERNVVIECMTNRAFYVASAAQITATTYDVLRGIGRKAHRQRRKLAAAKPENDLQRLTVEHQGRLMLAVERDAKKARMNALPNTAAPTPISAPPSAAKNGSKG